MDEDLRLACHSILSLQNENQELNDRVAVLEDQIRSQAQQLSHQQLELDKERGKSLELLRVHDNSVKAKDEADQHAKECEDALRMLQRERDNQREDVLLAEKEQQQRLVDEQSKANARIMALEAELKQSQENEAATKVRLTKQLIASVEALREAERKADYEAKVKLDPNSTSDLEELSQRIRLLEEEGNQLRADARYKTSITQPNLSTDY